jgi:hypothetical protein
MLSEGSQATLLAVDGHVISDVPRQLSRLPGNATHLGPRPAWRCTRSESAPVPQLTGGAPQLPTEWGARRYPDSQRRRLIKTALALLNDVITREAFTRRLSLGLWVCRYLAKTLVPCSSERAQRKAAIA